MLKRTVIKVEILYDDEHMDLPQNMELEQIAECIKDGPASGSVEVVTDEEVSREWMAELLEAQGSDPSFLLGDEEEDEDEEEE